MIIKKIQAFNFRNYENLNLEIKNNINIFYGKNAQGKTNILESIFFGAFSLSHRTNLQENLIKFGEDKMMVYLEFINNQGEHNIRTKKYLENGRLTKEILLDGKKTTLKDYFGFLNAVMFSPEDLQFVKGEPSLRRKFLDMQITQTNKKYWEILQQYNRVLKQRNGLLKQIREKEITEDLLDSWDEEFIKLAAKVCEMRMPAIKKLQNIASKIHKNISGGEELKIHYMLTDLKEKIQDGVNDYENYFSFAIKNCRQADIARGASNLGPHHDDLLLKINDKSLKDFGSQGQQRSAALALKLSQLEYIKQETNEYPVLLLDDVMSELDENRRNHLLKFINKKVQTFVTVNDKSLIPDLEETAYYEIKNGTIN